MNEQKPRQSKMWRTLKFALIVLVLVLLAGYLAVGAIAADKLTYAERLFTADTPKTYGMGYEDVTIPAREDGLEIAGWYIPAEGQLAEQAPAILMVHGWNASRTIGYNKHFLEMARALHQDGFAVLMIDLRGHGASADSRFTFGRYERRDVLGAVDYLQTRGHQSGKIGLLGVSMGAASVVGAAAENQAVGAVLTDSMFAEIYPVIKGLWGRESGLPQIFLYPTLWMFHIMNGYALESARPIEEIGQIVPRPLMMIHCAVDKDVPVEHFQRLQQAAPWAETWLIQGDCRHAESYEFMPQEYDQKVVGFFEKALR